MNILLSDFDEHFFRYVLENLRKKSKKKLRKKIMGSVVVFLKTTVAVVLKLTTAVAVAVVTYNFNSTKNWRKLKKYIFIKLN